MAYIMTAWYASQVAMRKQAGAAGLVRDAELGKMLCDGMLVTRGGPQHLFCGFTAYV